MSGERQHKIGSGFGFHSTADDVLAGIDLSAAATPWAVSEELTR